MAIYHFSVDVVQRSKGESSVAASAYRAGEKLTDERTGEIHDYTKKENCDYNEILLPDNAPEAYADRGTLWNAVEKKERRGDAQVCRSIDMALPNKMPEKLQEHMLREFCQEQFVEYGMAADLSIHRPTRTQKNDHAHVLLTMRELDESGFGNKNRSWNDNALVDKWREAWADKVNEYIDRFHIDENHIDHRSLEDQGIDRTPQVHMGKAATAMERKGQQTDRGNFNREIKALDAEIAQLQKIAENAIDITTKQRDMLEHGTPTAKDVQTHTDLLQHSRNMFDVISESGLLEPSVNHSLSTAMKEISNEVADRLRIIAEHLKMALRASESVTDRKKDIDSIISSGYQQQIKQYEELNRMEMDRITAMLKKGNTFSIPGWGQTKKKKPHMQYAISMWREDGTRRSLIEMALIFAVTVATGEIPDFVKPEWQRMAAEDQRAAEAILPKNVKIDNLMKAIRIAKDYNLREPEDIEAFLRRPDITPEQRRRVEFLMDQLKKSLRKDYCYGNPDLIKSTPIPAPNVPLSKLVQTVIRESQKVVERALEQDKDRGGR